MILMIAMIDDDGFWICPLHCPGNLRELHSDTEVQGTLEHLPQSLRRNRYNKFAFEIANDEGHLKEVVQLFPCPRAIGPLAIFKYGMLNIIIMCNLPCSARLAAAQG